MIDAHARVALGTLTVVLLAVGCVQPKPENQVMRLGDDLLASGSKPQVRDSVAGDAILAGGDVAFSGATGGDYVGAGGNQDIDGRIHGSLRAAGGHLEVNAIIDRNATIGGGDVQVDSGTVVGRNAYLIGGNVRVNGAVRGGLLATGRSVELNGPVGGDVEVAGGTLRLGPRAQITGNLSYRVTGDVQIDPAAKVGGKTTALPAPKGRGAFSLLWTAGVLLMGVVVVLLIPRFIATAAERIQTRPGRTVLVGIAVGILGLIVIVIAAVTVIGLPLAIIAVFFYLTFAALSGVPVAVWLGSKILHSRTLLGRQGPVVNFFIGALALLIIGVVPVIGALVTFIAACVGFGAMMLTAWATREEELA